VINNTTLKMEAAMSSETLLFYHHYTVSQHKWQQLERWNHITHHLIHCCTVIK